MRIYFNVNGEGYGHSSRALAIAKHLDPESVLFGSYGYVLERIKKAGYKTVTVTPEITFAGDNGAFDLSKTIRKNIKLFFTGLNQQIQEEKKILKKHKITCVVTDCRAAVVFAANDLGIPCIYVTNQTEFELFFRTQRKKSGLFGFGNKKNEERNSQSMMHAAMQNCFEYVATNMFKELHEVIIGDFPPPSTVCLPVLSRNPEIMKLQRIVGPLTQWRAEDVVAQERPTTKPFYVVGTMGGHAFRKPLFDAVIETARIMPEVHFDLISSFKAENVPENVRIIPFVDNPETYYKAADLVITQAGHSTAMELLSLGKPSIIVPDYRQVEQESNARRLEILGCSTKLTYPELNPGNLSSMIAAHQKTNRYRQAAKRVALSAQKLNGAETVANLVKDLAKRIVAY